MRYGKIPAGGGGGEVRWRNESHTSAHPLLFFLKFAEEEEVTEKESLLLSNGLGCLFVVVYEINL